MGTAPTGLRGLLRTGLPLAPPELNLSASGGFALTGSVDSSGGTHPRALGGIAAAFIPREWLAFALRLDGRVDFHAGEESGSYSGAVGDPRLLARIGTPLSEVFSAGAELGIWLPGRTAPSLELAATTLDVSGLLAFTPQRSAWSLLGSAGFRLDNSSHSAPDLTRLRPGDRLALGLSDFNAVLAGVGAVYRFASRAEAFGEFSADLLVGSGAPPLRQSPLRAAFGGRYFFSKRLQGELTTTLSLSGRPGIEPSDALVPIDPRVAIAMSVRYGFGLSGDPLPQQTPLRETIVEGPSNASFAGSLVDESGAPLPEAVVKLTASDGREQQTITDAQGRYRFADVPLGQARLDAKAIGFGDTTWEVEVRPAMTPEARTLTPAAVSAGVVRGLIRSFRSEPLIAQVAVRRRSGKLVANVSTDVSGTFELELPEGRYQVTITSSGYRTHRRAIHVGKHGVAILNVDMREK